MKTKVHDIKVFFDAIETAKKIKNGNPNWHNSHEEFLNSLDTETLQGILEDAVEFERYEVAEIIKNIINEKRI